MKMMKIICAVVLLVAVALATPGHAADVSKSGRPLWSFGVFPGLLSNKGVRAELKITKEQEPAIDDSLNKWRNGFVHKTEPGKAIDFYAIDKANFDGMMNLLAKTLDAQQMKRLKQLILQKSGMELFDYKEIRDALSLTDAQVTKLQKIHGDLLKEISGGGKGKYTQKEVHKLFNAYMHGVPERVRAGLSDEQRKKLQELIGEQFLFE